MSGNAHEGYLVLDGISVRIDRTEILHEIDLVIGQGEFFFLLGPSGCGKTTLLRTVAGFYRPYTGSIRLGGQVITEFPPYRRNTPMVFQNYALWPHLSVYENIAYGLRARRVPRAEIDRRVHEVLRLVQLSGFERRRPNQLSGGQQQRVALARALVVDPAVLLLDEPLSNLDARLRAEMRDELADLHRAVGVTAIYVTHDREEALSLADRIGIMRDGRVIQVGTPEELYAGPRTSFVAAFLDEANLFPATRTSHGLECPLGRVQGEGDGIMLRPDAIRLGAGPHVARIIDRVYRGQQTRYRLHFGDSELIAYSSQSFQPGEEVAFAADLDRAVPLTLDTPLPGRGASLQESSLARTQGPRPA
ncbi:MAG TPA: ABC transporter ATP-binding protein [Limnochordia bacterium]